MLRQCINAYSWFLSLFLSEHKTSNFSRVKIFDTKADIRLLFIALPSLQPETTGICNYLNYLLENLYTLVAKYFAHAKCEMSSDILFF